MKRILSGGLVAALLLMVPTVTSAHTGSIEDIQRCEVGTTVTAHLDANVADTATWRLIVNGSQRAHGTGPGAADLGPFQVGRSAGEASLIIEFGPEEKNTYSTDWPAVPHCPATWSFAARFLGPCEDPMHAAVLYNYSDRGSYMKWIRTDGGVKKVVRRWVPAHSLVKTAFRHVDGRTVMYVRARGEAVAEALSGKAGNYGPCPR